MYFILAWRNIWRNRRRTLIMLASVVFAIFFSCLMKSMHLGTWTNLIDNAVRFYTGYLQVHAKGYWDERTLDNSFINNPELQNKITADPEITLISPRLESFALASGTDRTKGAMIFGIDPEKENQLTSLKNKLRQGHYFRLQDKKVLLAAGLARFLKLGINDTLILIGQGLHGANAAGKYAVAGILEFPSPQQNEQLVYLPLPEAQWLFSAGNRLTSFAILVKDQQKVPQIKKELQQQLGNGNYEVMDWQEMQPELVQSFELDSIGGQVILFILYAVVGFGIFGTFLMMTAERRYEMGVMLSIGMGRGQLQLVMFLEVIILALSGALLGILFSLPVILYLHQHPIPVSGGMAEMYQKFGLEPIIPFSQKSRIFLQQAYVVAIITTLLGIYPLWFIQKLKPVKALRT